MRLVICEKPSVGMSIAAVLGVKSRHDGYIEGGEYIVSWCFGHLAGLASAEVYDEKYLKWRYDDLPILPGKWEYTIGNDNIDGPFHDLQRKINETFDKLIYNHES